jgi:hypothetical protein
LMHIDGVWFGLNLNTLKLSIFDVLDAFSELKFNALVDLDEFLRDFDAVRFEI